MSHDGPLPTDEAAAPDASAAPGTSVPPAGGAPPDRGEPPEPISRPRWWHRAVGSRVTPDRPCLNCGDPTVGPYCPSCGQRKVDVRVSLRRMAREALDDQLSLNSTLPRTLGALFFRPGHLTREYVQGRIMRYIPPFRLYLVSSLVFFLVLPLVADPQQIAMSEESETRRDSLRAAALADSVLLAHARSLGEDTTVYARSIRERGRVRSGGNVNIGPEPEEVGPLLRPVVRRMKRAEDRLNALPQREALRLLIETMEENAPVGVFVMMPFSALILKLLYVRRKRFYVEHFVFALHVHAFVFLAGAVILLFRSDLVATALLVWFLVYLFLALKRVYAQGFVRTFVKYVALGIAYSLLLFFGVASTVLLSVLSM
ncbi:MAG TPA: DUF3667 domain-containing protein [Longimicrobium sp.]|nr:DUF3667 domain-containing protein [Longimicrobium sp.]